MRIPEGLSRERWSELGSTLTRLAGSTMWLIGDWLAYGQENYHGAEGFERVECGIYETLADDTGYAVGTLRNAKMVCAAVKLSCRHDRLTFTHAQEIVFRAPKNQVDYWIDRATTPDAETGRLPSAKRLREALRKSTATHKAEPNDVGVTTDIEWLRQVERDFLHKAREWNPAMKREALKILKVMAEAVS